MKIATLSLTLLLGLAGTAALAQTPAAASATPAATPAAPPGATGQCKDGSYTTAESKVGACAGHKGVKTWMAAPGAVPLGASSADMNSSAATAASTRRAAGAATAGGGTAASVPTAANSPAGGGPDKVWVNTESKVYHCPGTKYYGKTKKGSYMTEAEATAAGNHADHKKACHA